MDAQFLTDCGQVRQLNEDDGGIFYNQSGQLLAVIADGMGGHQAGDVASSMAVSMVEESWEMISTTLSPHEAETWLDQTIHHINEKMYTHAQSIAECEGMGTTIVTAIMTNEFITVAHIGDSRCYLTSGDTLTQITKDHSLVSELIRSGEISKQEAQHHPRKNVVLKALGTQQFVNADIQTRTIEQKERILLCTDGLTDKVSDEEIEAFMNKQASIEQISTQMVELANERGGEDNISLILIDNNARTEEGEQTC